MTWIATLLIGLFGIQGEQPLKDSKTGKVERYVALHRQADHALQGGRYEEARRRFSDCLELFPWSEASAYGKACALARMGQTKAALAWLTYSPWADPELALWDEDLRSLRDDPEFQAAIERMRKSAEFDLAPDRRVFVERSQQGTYTCAQVAPDEDVVFAGSADGILSATNASDGTLLWKWKASEGGLWALDVRPDGRELALLSYDGKLMRIDPAGPTLLREYQFASPAGDKPRSRWSFSARLEYSPGGESLLAFAYDWNGGGLFDGENALLLQVHPQFFGLPTTFGPQGSTLWRLEGKEVQAYDARTGASIPGGIPVGPKPVSLAIHPRNSWIATGHEDGRIHLWALPDGRKVASSEPQIDWTGSIGCPATLSFSPSGDRLAVATTVGLRLGILDTGSATYLCYSDHLGGRMGEPGRVFWNSEGSLLFGAFASGVLPLHHWQLGLEGEPKFFSGARGPVPRTRGRNLAAVLHPSYLGLMDTSSGRYRWVAHKSTKDSKPCRLRQTGTGYFDCAEYPAVDYEWPNDPHSKSPQFSLSEVAHRLFDPKRVRAACAGVRIAKVRPWWE